MHSLSHYGSISPKFYKQLLSAKIPKVPKDTDELKVFLHFWDLGSISPTYLRTAFTPVAPKSVRIQSSYQYLFTLLGSTGAKAARRSLMKLTPALKKADCKRW